MKTTARLAAVVCALLMLLMAPLAHQDSADHAKSSTHCQLCAARPLAARAEQRVGVVAPALAAAGEVVPLSQPGFAAPLAFSTSGRSPPA